MMITFSKAILCIPYADMVISTLNISLYYALRYFFIFYMHHPTEREAFRHDFVEIVTAFCNCTWFTEDILQEITEFLQYSCTYVSKGFELE